MRIATYPGLSQSVLNKHHSCISQPVERDIKIMKQSHDAKLTEEILNWITAVEFGLQHSDYLSRRQPGTGAWLLSSETYQMWLKKAAQTLFCPGIPGAGKTILTSIVIDDISNRFHDDFTTAIAYVYCNFNRKAEQKIEDLMSSLLKQIAWASPSLHPAIGNLHEKHIQARTRPTLDEISRTIQTVASTYSRVFIVIDALDECQYLDGCRTRLLSELFNLQNKAGANIFSTSRTIPEVTREFEGSLNIEIRASENDIRRYLEGHISRLPKFVAQRSDLKDEITGSIMKAVDGM